MALRWPALLLALIMVATAGANPPAAEFELQATGRIEIGPDGRVQSHQLDKTLTPAVAEVISRSLATWQFEPVLVDGRPVVATTKLRLAVEALPQGEDSYRLRVRNVWFGEPERAHRMPPPHYPAEALRAGLGARVLLLLRIDGEGRVTEAFARQVSLGAKGQESKAEGWRKRFAEASVQAARRWRFTPGESVDGSAVGGTVAVPVVFRMSRGKAEGWQGFVPGPVRQAPWEVAVDAGALAAEATLGDGELRNQGSRFRLVTDVVGSTL